MIRELDVYDRGWKNGLQTAIDLVADLERESSLAGDTAGAEVLDFVAGKLLRMKREFLEE